MRSFIYLVCILACGFSSIVAAEPLKSRTCRILFLAPADNSPKQIYLNDGLETRQVDLPSLNFSNVYELAPGNIQVKLLPQMPVEGQPLAADLPSIAVAESIRDCYLLVTSDAKNASVPLKLQLIDVSPGKFKTGEMMWLNLTPYQVGGEVGSKTLNLKPNSQTVIGSPVSESGGYNVKIGYAPGEGKKPVLLISTNWMHNVTSRNLVFVTMLPNSNIPRIKGYSDYREPPKSDKAQQ